MGMQRVHLPEPKGNLQMHDVRYEKRHINSVWHFLCWILYFLSLTPPKLKFGSLSSIILFLTTSCLCFRFYYCSSFSSCPESRSKTALWLISNKSSNRFWESAKNRRRLSRKSATVPRAINLRRQRPNAIRRSPAKTSRNGSTSENLDSFSAILIRVITLFLKTVLSCIDLIYFSDISILFFFRNSSAFAAN